MAEISPEESERRRQVALRLHNEVVTDPETGEVVRRRFGGPQPGAGRPKKQRASTIVAEQARQHAEQIKDAFVDALDPMNHPNVRVNAARSWLEMEQKEEALAMAEERALEGMHRDALVTQLAEKLGALADRGLLPENFVRALPAGETDVIDG